MKNNADKWEDMLKSNRSLLDIKQGSTEFEIMKKAAENGDMSAQYSMGMWYDTVANDPETAKKWYNKAKNNGHPSAEQAIIELSNEVNHGK